MVSIRYLSIGSIVLIVEPGISRGYPGVSWRYIGISRNILGYLGDISGTSLDTSGCLGDISGLGVSSGISWDISGLSLDISGFLEHISGIFRGDPGISRRYLGASRDKSRIYQGYLAHVSFILHSCLIHISIQELIGDILGYLCYVSEVSQLSFGIYRGHLGNSLGYLEDIFGYFGISRGHLGVSSGIS